MKNSFPNLAILNVFLCLMSIQSYGQITELDLSKKFIVQGAESPEKVYQKSLNGRLQPLLQNGKGGGDIGGGKVIVCPKPSNESERAFSIETLDLYEGRMAGIRPDFGRAANLGQKIEFVLQRLDRIAPTRAYMYKRWILDFFSKEGEVQSDEGLYVPNVDDIGISRVPKACQVVQVIGQRDPVLNLNLSDNARYLLNREVYTILDDDSKLALIFHEIIYREARLYKIRTSESVRALTMIILSNKIDSMSTDEFNKLLLGAKLGCPEKLNQLQKCIGFDANKENEKEFFQLQQKQLPNLTYAHSSKDHNIALTGKYTRSDDVDTNSVSMLFFDSVKVNSIIEIEKDFKLNDDVRLAPKQFSPFYLEVSFSDRGKPRVFTNSFLANNKKLEQPDLIIERKNQIFHAENCSINGAVEYLSQFEEGTFLKNAISQQILPPDTNKNRKIFVAHCNGIKKFVHGGYKVNPMPADFANFKTAFSLVFFDERSPIIYSLSRNENIGQYHMMRVFEENEPSH